VIHIKICHSSHGESGSDAFVKIPRGEAAPRAAIVTLGGLRGGVRALEYVEDTGEFIVLAMDYPFEGRRLGPRCHELRIGAETIRGFLL
jgi:hypothetical protein